MKSLVCEAPVLKFYDVTQDFTIESDALLSGFEDTHLYDFRVNRLTLTKG